MHFTRWPVCQAVMLLILASPALAQAQSGNSGQFSGTDGLLNSCVALFTSGRPAKDASGRNLIYDVTLQLLSEDLVFRLDNAVDSDLTEPEQCSGRFETDTYSDVVRVAHVDAQTDGEYFIRMKAQEGEAFHLQLQEESLTRLIPPERFASAASYSRLYSGDALVVAKNGHVVFADFIAPFSSDDPHLLASGTKSFSFALFALGVMDGIWSLDEPVFETIGEWAGDARREAITIRHLLTLSSGLLDAPEHNATQVPSLDLYDLAINRSTQPYDVDTALIYGPVNFYVLSAVFERKTGLDPVDYLYERLLAQLGMKPEHTLRWTRDIKGKPQMAGGAWLDARTWLNYGQLMLQNGYWLGQQLLSADLVGLSTSIDNPAYQGYGLTWWRNTPLDGSYDPSTDSVPADARPTNAGEPIVADLPADLYFAAGLGRQRLYIVPSQNLVIVRFGMALSQSFSDNQLLLRIMDAFE